MLFDVLHEMPPARSGVVASALVRHIPKGAFNRIGLGARGREVEELKARMGSKPLRHDAGWVNLGIIHHHLEVGVGGNGVSPIQGLEQGEKEAGGFALPQTLRNRAGGDIEGPG